VVPADSLVAALVPAARFDAPASTPTCPTRPTRRRHTPCRCWRLRRHARPAPQGAVRQAQGPAGTARRLPGRRLRRRQDPPARLAVARGARAAGVRHLRRADAPGRRAGLRADGQALERAPACSPSTSSSWTTRRHGPGLHPARQAGRRRRPGRGDVQHAAGLARARAASPPRTSCGRSRRWPVTSRPCGWRARTTGTAAAGGATARSGRGAVRPYASTPARAATTSAHCSPTCHSCTRRGTARWWTA
jgi:hypothetical protein